MEFAANIPLAVSDITRTLTRQGFAAYLVGGCVRDMLLARTPRDWDITTDATPEQIISLFHNTYCNNPFGTVGVVTESNDPTTAVVEVTPFRAESEYSDNRRPNKVEFGVSLEKDLARRDFTLNAMAYAPNLDSFVDPYGGATDLKTGRIRAVGEPHARFNEDALRMLRAVRLATELSFVIDPDTTTAITSNASLLQNISAERIRDEFVRILESPQPFAGIGLLEQLGLLREFLPELREGKGCAQGGTHSYDVFEHLLHTLQAAADKDYSLEMRLAALFHDIGKPRTRREGGKHKKYTFFGHEVVGARMTSAIMQRMKFPRVTTEKVVKLVRWHMFFADPDEITLAAVRRTIARIGSENIEDLLNLRVCDRIGTGRPKEQPFRFRKYKAMVDQALRSPLSVGMLALSGDDVMRLTNEPPGKRIGNYLHALLEEVLEDPTKNDKTLLTERVRELAELPDEVLEAAATKGKQLLAAKESEAIEAIKDAHKVK